LVSAKNFWQARFGSIQHSIETSLQV